MKRRDQTLLAVAATIGLFGGIQNFTYAQGQKNQAPPSSGGQRSGDPAPPSRSGNSAADRESDESTNDGDAGRSPRRANPNPTPRPPTRNAGQAGTNDQRRPALNNPPPRTRPPTATPPPGSYVPRNNPPPGSYPPGNSTNPPPGSYPPGNSANPPPGSHVDRRRQINEQLAQRPIILAPSWYRANTWPWWYETYFPTFGFYGNGLDDYSGWDDDSRTAGGWYDDRYDERRRDRGAADAANERAATTPPPPAANPPAGQGAAALNADPAYRQALADVARLQARYDEASRKVLDKLKQDDADYRRLLQLRDRADDGVDAAQAASKAGTDPAKVAPAAQRKLEINTRITQMEQDAIRRDPEASAARTAMEEANARVAAMRQAAGVGPTAAPAAAPAPAPVTR